MTLEGSLDAFSLPDVLALLATTRKTGVLRLSGSTTGAVGQVRVRDGLVVAASSDDASSALLRRVVAAGLVTDDALGTAATAAEVVAGVPPDELVPIAREQVVDAVFELLRWRAGSFSFAFGGDDLAVNLPADLQVEAPVQLAVEDVVAEGQARLAAWPELVMRVPAADAVLSLVPVPAETPSCSVEEWGLLALVGAGRSVSALVEASGRGEWTVVSLLAGLVERGLLTASADPVAGSRRSLLLAALEGPADDPLEPQPVAVDVDVVAADESVADESAADQSVADDNVLDVLDVLPEQDADVTRSLLLRLTGPHV